MLKKLQKRNSEGFTIIEVMIVLAIAALILLIVLLAVPALQRNSRNTSIKNDASAIVAAVGEYESNNDGSIPGKTGSLSSGSTVTIAPSSGSATNATAKVQSDTVVTGTGTAPSVPAASNIIVLYKYKCNNGSTYSGSSDVAANPRSVAVIYAIETSGSGVAGKCVDS